jgi:lipid II:glycine glycyltransferase (peptidoglycan interpeptide bridge formation enzyme)
VRPFLVLCTRSPTPATILVTARHAAPATCTSQDKQTRFFKRNKEKVKQPKCPRFKFKPRQVNDSSQTNQETDHLVSQNQNLPYTESSYNNSYQESLKITFFETLYGRRRRTPLFWNKTGERKVLDPTYCKEPRYKFVW